jgi:hypothetical protein
MARIEGFRVYFECLEQAEHFGIDAIKSAIHGEPSIELVRLPSSSRHSGLANSLVRGLQMKNPDLVITAICQGNEIPLVWVEISTAVLAEDHVQQRFDSVVAAHKMKVVFVKIEAPRVSPSAHGGNVSFDRSEFLKLGRQKLGVHGFHLIWPTTADGLRAIRSPVRASCPESTLGLEQILKVLINIVERNGDLELKELLDSPELPANFRMQLDSHTSPIATPGRKRSTRLFQSGSDWTLKFNRWAHAMDPERGMSWYHRYRIGQPLCGQLHDKDATTPREAIRNFSRATGIAIDLSPQRGSTVDITESILDSSVNRSGLAIIQNCKEFVVCTEDGTPLVRLVWTSVADNQIATDNQSSLIAPAESTNEDEVTYSVCNAFVRHLKLQVHSISYPGAQGDFAVLEGEGRATKRTYFDLIAVDNPTNPRRILLVESKGNRNRASISPDIEKVSSWRDDSVRRQNLLSKLGAASSASVEVACAYPGDDFLFGHHETARSLDFEITVDRTSLRYRTTRSPRSVYALDTKIPKQFEVKRGTI